MDGAPSVAKFCIAMACKDCTGCGNRASNGAGLRGSDPQPSIWEWLQTLWGDGPAPENKSCGGKLGVPCADPGAFVEGPESKGEPDAHDAKGDGGAPPTHPAAEARWWEEGGISKEPEANVM
jgi:hypothetical protein